MKIYMYHNHQTCFASRNVINLIHAGADPGFGQGGAPGPEADSCDVAKQSCAREASNLRPGSRARLRALEAFGFLMLKYAFSHILGNLFL